MRLSLLVLSNVLVSVGEVLLTSAVLEEVLEVTGVCGSSCMEEGSSPVLFVVFPLSFILTTFGGGPYSMPFLLSFYPFPFVTLTTVPLEFPKAMSSSLSEMSSICSYYIPLYPCLLAVLREDSFKYFFFGEQNAIPLPASLTYLSKVDFILFGNYLEILSFHQGLNVESWLHWLVADQILRELLFCFWYVNLLLLLVCSAVGFGCRKFEFVGVEDCWSVSQLMSAV